MPGFEHRADGRSGMAGNRLHEDVLVSRTVLERGDQQGVQPETAGQAEVAAGTGHADGGGFHGLLDAGREMWSQLLGTRLAVLQSDAFIEARAEAAVAQTVGREEGTVEARAGVGKAEDFEEEVAEPLVAGHRKPLHLVLIFVGFEAQQFGDAAVEVAERIRRVLLVLERHVRAVRLPARSAAEIAAAVERQNRSLVEW